ncbi:MAG: TonB-dependent receptor, partial [Bacteroidetes bacterium]
MRNHPTILLFLALLLSFSLTAQNRGQRGGGESIPAVVKGKIVDAGNENPLEFATVTLFSKNDSSMVTGGISDERGIFQIETQPGDYFARIEFIGYQPREIADIVFGKSTNLADLGTIALLSDATMLSEVEVRAEKSVMQISLDKKVFNVGKDLANQGGTAENILDNVPSVTVDIEGNVALRGSSNVRILVNGKPSGAVNNANGLRSIPANLIDRVEVITNPSARYEAEGMAGIINIVLRKQEGKGLNGSFDLTVGHPDNFGTAINLNY